MPRSHGWRCRCLPKPPPAEHRERCLRTAAASGATTKASVPGWQAAGRDVPLRKFHQPWATSAAPQLSNALLQCRDSLLQLSNLLFDLSDLLSVFWIPRIESVTGRTKSGDLVAASSDLGAYLGALRRLWDRDADRNHRDRCRTGQACRGKPSIQTAPPFPVMQVREFWLHVEAEVLDWLPRKFRRWRAAPPGRSLASTSSRASLPRVLLS
jgi:hypothetical protein